MATNSKASGKSRGVSRRDDFSAKVLMILYKRAGGKCCRCGAPTFGPDTNPHKSVNIGQGAHIAAAAPLGPRYDEKMTPEERSSATNGMWLCSNCHDIIDRDVKEYPTSKLKKMKKDAEELARREVGVARDSVSSDNGGGSLASGVSAATIVEIRKYMASLVQLNNKQISAEDGQEYLDKVDFVDFDKEHYLPDVGRELLCYLRQLVVCCQDASVQMEVIRRLKSMCEAYKPQFTKKDVEEVVLMAKIMVERVRTKTRSKLYQSAVALLKDLTVMFKAKGFNKPATDALKQLKGRDETDAHPEDIPPEAKRSKQENEEENAYLEIMERLSRCTDIEEALELEAELVAMGYEPNIA